MPKLINKNAIMDNPWTVIEAASGPEILQSVHGKKIIVPLQFWKDRQNELSNHDGDVAVWLDSNETPAEIANELHSLPLIALNFPAFSDGRSYTNARELRQKYDYKGEIRAIGDVLRDQLYYMSQCGFDSFELRQDQDEETCLNAFKDFKTAYQSTIPEPIPLFRRR